MRINNMTDVWNAGATTFSAIKMNVTNTASAALSKLIDLQIAAVSLFSVDKNGHVRQTGNHYMPSGGVQDWGAGNVTLTHASGSLTWLGASAYTFQYSDAGATVGPNLVLDRNSASPAISDVLGAFTLRGRDSGGNAVDYADILGTVIDPTNGSEDGQLSLRVQLAGSIQDVLRLYSTGTAVIAAIDGVQRLVRGGSVTISAGGSVSITHSYHAVDTNGGAASDNLDDIFLASGTTPEEGMTVTIVPVSNARSIIVRHNQGASVNSTILNQSGASITLGTSYQTASYVFRSSVGWIQTGGKIT